MTNYDLYQLFSVLEPKELPVVRKFLESPFHNTNKDCVALFNAICKHRSKQQEKPPTNKALYAQVFGEPLPSDDVRLRKVRGELTRLLKRYFAFRELDQSERHQRQMLVKALSKRRDYQLFKSTADETLEMMENKPAGAEYFKESGELFHTLYEHPETEKITHNHDYLRQSIHSTEAYFTLLTLQNGIECLLRQRTVASAENVRYLQAVDTFASEAPYANQPAIVLFHRIYKLFTKPHEPSDFQDMKNLLESSLPLLEEQEQRMAVRFLANFGTPYSNKGNRDYTRFCLDCYKLGIAHRLFLDGAQTFNPATFVNIVIAGASCSEFEWTKSFINEYEPLLPKTDRKIVPQFCLASWHYQKGSREDRTEDLLEAHRCLNKLPQRTNEKYDLRIRSLRLRVYFDLYLRGIPGFENVLEKADQFKKHLTHNPTYSDQKKKEYFDFIQRIKTLFKIASQPALDIDQLHDYLSKIRKDDPPILGHWLLERAEGLAVTSRHRLQNH
jgi:hypothetical protein